MESNNVDELLEKYYEGKTNNEEESFLKTFFSSSSLPEKYIKEKQWFDYLNSARKNAEPDFDVNLILDNATNNCQIQTNSINFSQFKIWISSAAAILLICLGIYFINLQTSKQLKDTYNDKHRAYLETKKALLYISNCMNKNTKKLKYLSTIDYSFNKINKLNKIDMVINSVKSNKTIEYENN